MKRVFTMILALMTVLSGVLASAACAPADRGAVSITIWTYYNGEQKNAFQSLVDEYNETEGKSRNVFITVSAYGTVGELISNVEAAADHQIGHASLPTMFASYADTAYLMDQKGIVANLDPYFTEAELGEYVDGYLDEGRFGDGTLKIFPTAKSTEILILNKTDWNKFVEGVSKAPFNLSVTMDDLKTIEGVVRISEAYYNWTKAETGIGKAFFGRDAMANYMIIGAKQFGKEIFSVDETGKVTYTLDSAVMRKLWDNFYVPYVKGYFTAEGKFRSDDMKTGKLIALVGSNSSATYFKNEVATGDGPNDKYEIEGGIYEAPIFADGESVAVQQGAGMVVVKNNEAIERACADFLKWFTEKNRNMKFASESGYLPVKKEASSVSAIKEFVDAQPDMTNMVKESLVSAATTVSKKSLYTSKPFVNGNSARDVLENSLLAKSKGDRAAIEKAVKEEHLSREEALKRYLTDANFESWLTALTEALNAVSALK